MKSSWESRSQKNKFMEKVLFMEKSFTEGKVHGKVVRQMQSSWESHSPNALRQGVEINGGEKCEKNRGGKSSGGEPVACPPRPVLLIQDRENSSTETLFGEEQKNQKLTKLLIKHKIYKI
jgi:hypothetical protein